VRHTRELVEVAANPISPQVGVAAESGDPQALVLASGLRKASGYLPV
jgi:hypothetical protein